jgi:glycosyltransferase involved in cell wall biosynthesis
VANGYDVTLIRRKSYVQNEYKGVKLIDVDTPKKKSFEAIIHTFKAILKAKKNHAKIIHIHAVGPAILTPLARILGLKVVFTHHGFDYERARWGKLAKIMLKFGERMGCLYANEVIVISEGINQFIRQKYNRKNAHLIYNGVPAPNFVQSTSYLEELGIKPKKYIFAMGRFVPEKNFHHLIQAFTTLASNEYQLVLAGEADFDDDYSRKLKKLARKEGVVLTGFVKGEKLQAILTHALVFVLPSSHEGLPISLLEAMSYHLPVIASNIPANLEIGLPLECYFRVGDENDLAEHLLKKIKEEPQSVDYEMEKYNWDYIARKVMDVYQKALL